MLRALRDLPQTGSDDLLADPGGVGDHALVLHRVDRRDRGRARERMPGVRQTSGIGHLGEGVVDGIVHDDAAERDVPGVDALGEGDDVGDDVEVLEGEPPAGAAEAGHHLVGDEDDVVGVGERPHALHVLRARDHDARGAGDRFEDDRGDRRRALEFDRALEVAQGALGLLRLGGRGELGAVEEGAEEVDDTGIAEVVPPPARIAGDVDRRLRAPVVRAVAGEDLVPAGVEAGHADRVLVGVGPAVGEEDVVEAGRGALGDEARGLRPGGVGVGGADRAEQIGLVLDCLDDLGMLVADVRVDELGGEVEQRPALAVIDVRARRAGDGHRVERPLSRPRMEDVGPVEVVGPGGFVPDLRELRVAELLHDRHLSRSSRPLTEARGAASAPPTLKGRALGGQVRRLQ